MIGFHKEIEIVRSCGNNKKTTQSVMPSCEKHDTVVVGSKQRTQLAVCKKRHQKYSDMPLYKDHEKQCSKPANLFFLYRLQTFVYHLRTIPVHN